MKVLVVGGGGREHALVWKVSQSAKVTKIYAAPGNAGIAELAECVPVKADDIPGLLAFARKEVVDLTIVGPEGPLSMGIVDEFTRAGLRIFGPSGKAAEIEGSKRFSKDLMKKYHIPTAEYGVFTDKAAAEAYVRMKGAPIVVKADGLAAGKGVVVAETVEEAVEALDLIMVQKAYGAAGDRVVIEECLKGEEASFMAFSDGKTVVAMASSQDHKRVFDADKGPNTGGMGAYSPAPIVTKELEKRVMKTIMIPTVQAMEKEGRLFKGVLYAGLMIDNGDAKVLEFNARFGDPETQPIMARLETDLITIIEAILDGTLSGTGISWKPDSAVCVVMASGGYPGNYEKGREISGLDSAARQKNVMVFHSGTALRNGRVATDGGRVLGVTGLGPTVAAAIDTAYAGVRGISFEGAHYRRDIGARALETGN
ncbi:MAG: phosphoribosylamine--glycine ligase [Nitrospirae bacterium GWD2_57_9]|nr:MAG: phosphoribosylamine--glycine ligase [Nitrospirae bacterium GWD2_57_9]OGW48913.1 MAG: phosphoribosylamine--glycine ligase [Nitrospirae bacterium GWC2_57_9]